MYHPKSLNASFVILCPDGNIGNLKHTIKSLKFRYPESSCVCTVEQSTPNASVKEMKEVCPTFKGKKSITSLINTGMRHTQKGWNLIIIAGSWLQGREITKFSHFVEDEDDILFPIAHLERDGKKYPVTSWEHGTINGILMHTNAFKKIGPMADDNPLEICKIMWACEAKEKGCRIKAILGLKII